jgi:sec-independent protein translocase protein TatC
MNPFWKIVAAPFRMIWAILSAPFRGAKKIYHFMTDVPEDRPLAETISTALDQREAIIEQIEILRKHILRSAIVLALCVGVAFFFVNQVASFLTMPIDRLHIELQAVEVTEPFSVFMNIALMVGVAAAVPYIAFEMWWFVAPGLMPRTRINSLLLIPLAGGLFVGGMLFAYYIMLPNGMPIILHWMKSINPHPTADSYFKFATGLIFWIGVAFEFPLVIYALAALGIVTPKMLLHQWRIAIVVIAIVAAAITPTVDPVNMGLVMLPMTILYFASIALSQIAAVARRKDREKREQAGTEV